MDTMYARVSSLKSTKPKYGLDSSDFMKTMIGNIYKVSERIGSSQYSLYNERAARSYYFDVDDLEVFTEDYLATVKQERMLKPLLFNIDELNI